MRIPRTYISLFSRFNRKRKLKFIEKYIRKNNINHCLIVGATPLFSNQMFENLIERQIEQLCEHTIFSGLENDGGDWPNWVQANGLNLPFKDKEFDLVISNAVIEHVGQKQEQRSFIHEHARVGKHWIVTTPNRLFPVESHTGKLFVHMRKSWTHESYYRILTKKELLEILPTPGRVKGNLISPTFIAYD